MFSRTPRLLSLLFLEFSGFYILFSFQGSDILSRLASLNIQRRRRDLNPRAATNDLLPFQGSPFSHLGTSADWHFIFNYLSRAERVGFEPTRPCGQTVFKTASLWPLRYLSKRAQLLYHAVFHLSRTFLFFYLNFLCFFIKEKSFKAVTFRLFLLFSAAVLSGNERYSITVFDRSQLFFSSFLFFSWQICRREKFTSFSLWQTCLLGIWKRQNVQVPSLLWHYAFSEQPLRENP